MGSALMQRRPDRPAQAPTPCKASDWKDRRATRIFCANWLLVERQNNCLICLTEQSNLGRILVFLDKSRGIGFEPELLMHCGCI